jgi:hypothetical protein
MTKKNMPTFVIEDSMPIPPKPPRPQLGPREPMFPYAQLKIGQSFFVPRRTVKSMYSTYATAKKRNKHEYELRDVEGGVRVWRVK